MDSLEDHFNQYLIKDAENQALMRAAVESLSERVKSSSKWLATIAMGIIVLIAEFAIRFLIQGPMPQ